MLRPLRAGLAVSALLAAGFAVPASAATVVYEVHYIESQDAIVRVEVQRDKDFDAERQPVILTLSPYNSLGETRPAADSVARYYNPKGYARAKADVIGTRGSTGCWDYGGTVEQQSGADVVRWLADRPWSNGRVGMTGGSYDGTTATMVAALGDEISADANGGKGLAGIVPIAAISRWYGYAYMDGVRFLGNSRTPTDEGFDTPLAFDLGFGKTVPADPTHADFAKAAQARAAECGTVEHTERGYDSSPDYDAFWQERDYRKDAAAFRVPVLLAHGWQDYNVKQEEATALFEALPVDDPATSAVEGVPFKKLFMTQGTHGGGTSAPGYQALLDAFWAKTLKGADTGVENGPAVLTVGRTATGAGTQQAETTWPPAGTNELVLHLGPAGTLSPKPSRGTPVSHVDAGTTTEEAALATGAAPSSAWLKHVSEPLTTDLRVAGSAVLDAVVQSTAPGQHLAPVLVEVLPNGSYNLVERGHLNLDYRNGLAKAEPATGAFVRASARMLPQDYTFKAGSRIGVVLMGSNTVWAVPGSPGQLTYATAPVKGAGAGTRLVLPVVGQAPETALPAAGGSLKAGR